MSDIEMQKQTLLAKWMESELSDQEQRQFESWCKEDKAFAEKVALHGRLEFMAENFQQQEVPEWDASGIFKAPERYSLWQWKGLPAMSFAMSLFAVLLVTFKLEVTVHDGSMTISFGGKADQRQIEQLVNDKFMEYAELQDNKYGEKSDYLQQQQMQMNTQLARHLLDTSRSERREDFAELIKHVNQQREDDQVFFARQINNLKTDIELESDSPE